MLTAQDIVSREVHYCVSSLVSTLAQGAGECRGVADLIEQACDLAAPIDDWEEAAIQEGRTKDGEWHGYDHDKYPNWLAAETNGECDSYSTAQEACEANDIDPYQREVYEHWIVSDWLADKLEAAGEKVDRDFAGMTVWARTTTGQAIYADGFFEQLAASLSA